MAGTGGNVPQRRFGSGWIAAAVIAFCIIVGVIVWAGGWGFSTSNVPSPNPAPPAPAANPPAQMPINPPPNAPSR